MDSEREQPLQAHMLDLEAHIFKLNEDISRMELGFNETLESANEATAFYETSLVNFDLYDSTFIQLLLE